MPYKKKLVVLSSTIVGLVIIYVLSFVFSNENRASRSAKWAALAEPESAMEINITGGDDISLERTNENWFLKYNSKTYPAKKSRVLDLFSALKTKGQYAVRSHSEASYEKFGIGKNKIVLKKGENTLLSLYLGNVDATGKEIFLRKEGDNAVRSGKDIFSEFVTGSRQSWYDLHLFPDRDKLDIDKIQRVSIVKKDGETKSEYSLSRNENGWKLDGSTADPSAVDSALRFILDSSGEDFADSSEVLPEEGRLVLEIGDGSSRSITLMKKNSDEKYSAVVSDSKYVYILGDWTVSRIWKAKEDYLEVPLAK
jgi:hypothetical protein